MSIINRFLVAAIEPEFKLARDLTAIAISDGLVTPEEKDAIKSICQLEEINETTLVENLQVNNDNVDAEIPKTRKEKEDYLKKLIQLIGADQYASAHEIYLFQIIASRMGLNKMDVTSLFLLTASRRYFKGETGAKVLASFLKNHIDPKCRNERENRECLRSIYESVANHTERQQDKETDRELLRQNLERATETFLENKIIMQEFKDMNLDFPRILKEEELRAFNKYC